MAVFEASSEAIKRARAGLGPSLVECKTYRHHGHFEGDPTVYRSKEEVDMWMKKDPIPRFESVLKEMNVLTDASIAQIKADIGAEVEAAVKFAEESPWPEAADLLTDVYTGEPVQI
jgi:pyruvate dehydrogenase E1 component alpha subunit